MEFAEIPKDVLPGLSVLTVTGNVELTLENYRGILEYTGELVRVQVKGGQLKVTGEHLMISYYTNDADPFVEIYPGIFKNPYYRLRNRAFY